MRDELTRIGSQYLLATREKFADHPLAKFIREEAPQAVREVLQAKFSQYIVGASPGKGRWAEVPWIAVFDPAITDSATSGFYVVYLFSAATNDLYLSLNQGTTAVRAEFKAKALEILRDRAKFMRARLGNNGPFTSTPIALGSSATLPSDYEAGHVIGKRYDAAQLPSEHQLTVDLVDLIGQYQRLVFLGGYDTTPDEDQDPVQQQERPLATSVDERRQYRLHRKLERRSKTSELVKKHHGTICQVCGMSFVDRYGLLGEGYIEAHHLRPLSSLRPGEIVTYDIASDFCVLCANCHRMIHRQEDPSDLDGLRHLCRQALRHDSLQ